MDESSNRRKTRSSGRKKASTKVADHDGQERTKSSDSSEAKKVDGSSPGRKSPEPDCAICLGRLQNKSFTDKCFHMFCFVCLQEWSKVKAECPLCKQKFTSIIHNVRSNEDYDQYPIPPKIPSWEEQARNFRYHTTLTLERRLQINIPDFRQHPQYHEHDYTLQRPSLHHPMTTRSHWRRQRQAATSDFRKRIYTNNLRVVEVTDRRLRTRDISPAFIRSNPACTHRLVPWLNRELNALLHSHTDHVQFVLELIIGLIKNHPINSEEFYQNIYPYVGRYTRQFMHEFESFARSPYNMAAYDQHAVYQPHTTTVESDSDTDSIVSVGNDDDDDDDVIVISPSQEGARRLQPSPPHCPMDRGNLTYRDLSPLLHRVRSFLEDSESSHLNVNTPGWDSPTPGPSWAAETEVSNSSVPTTQAEDTPFGDAQGKSEIIHVTVKTEDEKHVDVENSESNSSSGNSDSSDAESDIVIVGYDRPWQERSPILLSSDDETQVTTHTKSKDDSDDKGKGQPDRKSQNDRHRSKHSSNKTSRRHRSRSRSRSRSHTLHHQYSKSRSRYVSSHQRYRSRSRENLRHGSRSKDNLRHRSRSRESLRRRSRSRDGSRRRTRSRESLKHRSRSKEVLRRRSRSRESLRLRSRSRESSRRRSRSRESFRCRSRSREGSRRRSRSRESLRHRSRSRGSSRSKKRRTSGLDSSHSKSRSSLLSWDRKRTRSKSSSVEITFVKRRKSKHKKKEKKHRHKKHKSKHRKHRRETDSEETQEEESQSIAPRSYVTVVSKAKEVSKYDLLEKGTTEVNDSKLTTLQYATALSSVPESTGTTSSISSSLPLVSIESSVIKSTESAVTQSSITSSEPSQNTSSESVAKKSYKKHPTGHKKSSRNKVASATESASSTPDSSKELSIDKPSCSQQLSSVMHEDRSSEPGSQSAVNADDKVDVEDISLHVKENADNISDKDTTYKSVSGDNPLETDAGRSEAVSDNIEDIDIENTDVAAVSDPTSNKCDTNSICTNTNLCERETLVYDNQEKADSIKHTQSSSEDHCDGKFEQIMTENNDIDSYSKQSVYCDKTVSESFNSESVINSSENLDTSSSSYPLTECVFNSLPHIDHQTSTIEILDSDSSLCSDIDVEDITDCEASADSLRNGRQNADRSCVIVAPSTSNGCPLDMLDGTRGCQDCPQYSLGSSDQEELSSSSALSDVNNFSLSSQIRPQQTSGACVYSNPNMMYGHSASVGMGTIPGFNSLFHSSSSSSMVRTNSFVSNVAVSVSTSGVRSQHSSNHVYHTSAGGQWESHHSAHSISRANMGNVEVVQTMSGISHSNSYGSTRSATSSTMTYIPNSNTSTGQPDLFSNGSAQSSGSQGTNFLPIEGNSTPVISPVPSYFTNSVASPWWSEDRHIQVDDSSDEDTDIDVVSTSDNEHSLRSNLRFGDDYTEINLTDITDEDEDAFINIVSEESDIEIEDGSRTDGKFSDRTQSLTEGNSPADDCCAKLDSSTVTRPDFGDAGDNKEKHAVESLNRIGSSDETVTSENDTVTLETVHELNASDVNDISNNQLCTAIEKDKNICMQANDTSDKENTENETCGDLSEGEISVEQASDDFLWKDKPEPDSEPKPSCSGTYLNEDLLNRVGQSNFLSDEELEGNSSSCDEGVQCRENVSRERNDFSNEPMSHFHANQMDDINQQTVCEDTLSFREQVKVSECEELSSDGCENDVRGDTSSECESSDEKEKELDDFVDENKTDEKNEKDEKNALDDLV